jgi:hypothetical protein
MSIRSSQRGQVTAVPNAITYRLAFLNFLHPDVNKDTDAKGKELLGSYGLIFESDGTDEIDIEVLALEKTKNCPEQMRAWLIDRAGKHLASCRSGTSGGDIFKAFETIAGSLGFCEAAILWRRRQDSVFSIHKLGATHS